MVEKTKFVRFALGFFFRKKETTMVEKTKFVRFAQLKNPPPIFREIIIQPV